MVHIIGAGMAGLLAGCMFRSDCQVYEASPKLPNNHHALLRFKSDEIGRYLNLPFKKVEVMKISKNWRNPVADAISYSTKCTGHPSIRSSTTAKGDIERRYIAPPNFIGEMERFLHKPIFYATTVSRPWIDNKTLYGEPIISTMPMPVLAELLEYPHRQLLEFNSTSGVVMKVLLPFETDICATIYYPDPTLPYSRATLTGSLLQIEIPIPGSKLENVNLQRDQIEDRIKETFDYYVRPVLDDFGFLPAATRFSACRTEVVVQKYAKILPTSERERKKFIIWATDNFNIYSLGRFATWKPGLLLDDVFDDIQTIQQMILNGNYEGRKK